MPLSIGARLGPYEVLAPIGSGGMGEVYKARDMRLDRTVAIKVLPEALASDPTFRERFDREAKAIASLQHPHICTLHDVGHQDGIDYLVLEYLDGQTLADRLTRGALPIDQVLTYSIQIADALDKAHRAGIVHRDLKPGNIMVTKGGVKLLDFGLAKTRVGGPGLAGGLSALPTEQGLTAHGTILGTFQYMAPEQLEGHDADARTDIFAFGAVAYEMVTGKKAFEAKSQASLISAIMSSEPPPIASLQPMTPPALDQIVRTCLSKEPDERWQTAGDVERQLRFIADGRSQVGTVVAAPGAIRRRYARTLATAIAGSVAGAIVAALVVWGWARGVATVLEPQRVSVVVPSTQPVAFGWFPGLSLALSPDGTEVAYVGADLAAPPGPGRNRLYVRSLDGLAVREVPGTADARQPFFSPDGRWVAFFTPTGELKKVSLDGGNPLTLVEKINGGEWSFGSWIDDDSIIFTSRGGAGLQRIQADGGSAQQLTTVDTSQGERVHARPEFVAEGRAVLFDVEFRVLRDPRIDAVMLDTGERRVVLENAHGAHYLNSGHLLFQRDEAILIAPFDPARLALTGPAVPLVDEVRGDGNVNQGAELAVSRSGTLAYVPAVDTRSALGSVSRSGTFEPLGLPPNRFDYPRVSPDGRYIAFTVSRGQETEVQVHDVVRGTTTKLTQEGSDAGPAWHPNNQALAVSSTKQNARGLFLKDLNGGERLLVPAEGATQLRNASWSPDGKLLAYTAQTGSQHDIWVLTISDKPAAQPLVNSPASEHSPRFSPDGTWLAYVSDESGRPEVYVRRYPQGDRFPVSTSGGVGPVWSPDGEEVFFQGPYEDAQKLMVVSVTVDRGGVRLGKPTPVFDMRTPGPTGAVEQYANSANSGVRYDIFPDGQRFVMIRQADSQGTREIVLVQNWLEEVKRIAPRK